MTLEEYMNIKFPKGKVKALSNIEAKLLGISLEKGWFKRNKDLELDQRTINKLVEYNLKNKHVSGNRKTRLREMLKSYSDWEGQYVYFMKNEIGRLKIGVSKDPVNRAWNITTGSGLFTEVVAYWEVDKNSRDIESILLTHFKKYTTYGEWFISTTEITVQSIEEVLDQHCLFRRKDIIIQLEDNA